jgi:hypothetical protein
MPTYPKSSFNPKEMDTLRLFATCFTGHDDATIKKSANSNERTSKKQSKSKTQCARKDNESRSTSLLLDELKDTQGSIGENMMSQEYRPVYGQNHSPGEDSYVSNGASSEISVSQVRENDVIFERGGFSVKHPGNKAYRAIIDEIRPVYKSTNSRKRKSELVDSIINFIMKKHDGRFLVRDNDKTQWTTIGISLVRLKISQALRDDRVGPKQLRVG